MGTARIKRGAQPEEQAWLAAHPELRLAVDSNWPPFEFIDDEQHYQGLAADYVALIEQRLPIKLPPRNWSEVLANAKNGQVHLLPSITTTPARQQYLTFTRPYLDFPIVILAQENDPQPRRLRELEGLTVAVVETMHLRRYCATNCPRFASGHAPA